MLSFLRRRLALCSPMGRSTRRAVSIFGSFTVASLATAHCATENSVGQTRLVLPNIDYTKPMFDSNDITIIFVLGGPGAGKGTQCKLLTEKYPEFEHISAGDLLREERNSPNSMYGDLINRCIADGAIVPFEITISLLQKAIKKSGKCKFLIDGFPRAIDQGEAFERAVCKGSAVIFYDCPFDVLEKRLMKRGQSSGRVDDNIESIRKRFVTFTETTVPVVKHYEKQGIVHVIDSSLSTGQVFLRSCEIIDTIIKSDANHN